MKLAIYALFLAFILLNVGFSRADVVGVGLGEITFLIIIPLVVVNFVINFVIVKALWHVFRNFKFTKVEIRQKYSILGITIIGLVADLIAISLSSWIFAFSYLSIITTGLLVLLICGFSSYFIIFNKTLKHEKAVLSSAIFGLISNPIWILLIFFHP